MMGPNGRFAERILGWFRSCGGDEIVLCAGARNLALVSVATHSSWLRVWHHPEERSAGFFALGRSKATSRPVGLVVTSGTAVAELLPSVIEAYYQGLPLVILSADRPSRYRGTGSPQTIIQPGLFGPHARYLGEWEAISSESVDLPRAERLQRPVHVNLCFDEPVLDDQEFIRSSNLPEVERARICDGDNDPLGAAPDWDGFGGQGRLLVMIGALESRETEAVARFVRNLAAPTWVEATSGLWGYSGFRDCWVRNPAKLPKPTHVLRLGGVPCDRFWRDLENEPGIQVRSWSSQGWAGLARANESARVHLATLRVGNPCGVGEKVLEDARVVIPSALVSGTETWWIAKISEKIPNDSLVFLGNSLPIREWQAAASWRGGLAIYANRGANGIDGEVSTFLGLAADHAGESWGIFGDLTTLYDLAGPWILAQMPERKIRIVVINNGGGAIFRMLPSLAQASERTKGTVCNNHSLEFSGWAKLWGLEYLRLTTDEGWPQSLPSGPMVLEVVPRADS